MNMFWRADAADQNIPLGYFVCVPLVKFRIYVGLVWVNIKLNKCKFDV